MHNRATITGHRVVTTAHVPLINILLGTRIMCVSMSICKTVGIYVPATAQERIVRTACWLDVITQAASPSPRSEHARSRKANDNRGARIKMNF